MQVREQSTLRASQVVDDGPTDYNPWGAGLGVPQVRQQTRTTKKKKEKKQKQTEGTERKVRSTLGCADNGVA